MLIHILTSFTKEEAKNLKIDYIKVLGFNEKGQKYLNKIKKEINIPIITSNKKAISPLLNIEKRVESIYLLPIENNSKKENKPIIVKTNKTNN